MRPPWSSPSGTRRWWRWRRLVIRLTPGPVAERAISVLGHFDKPFLVGVVLLLLLGCFALAGRAGPRRLVPAAARLVPARRRGPGRRPEPAGCRSGRRPAGRRRPAHLGDAALRAHRRPRPGAASARPGVARATRLPHGRRCRVGRRGRHRRRRTAGGSRAPARRGQPAAAPHPRRHPAPGAREHLGRPGRHRALGDAQRGLLPDRHDHREAHHRAGGVVAAHPRHGRPRADPQLLRPGLPPDDAVVDHAQLREQRGRRRPGGQRPLERHPHRRPARRPRRLRRRRLRAPDLARRLDLRDPARGPHRRAATPCSRWR